VPGDLGLTELLLLGGVALVGFGAVKFMLMAKADKDRERAAPPMPPEDDRR